MLIKEVKFIIAFLFLSLSLTSGTNDNAPKFVFYYGPTLDLHQSYTLRNVRNVLQHPKFNHSQTNVYMHGYNVSQDASSVQLVVEAYLKRNSINLLTIDWAKMAGGSYVSAQENVLKLAPRVAQSILKLFRAGLEKDSLQLVGHSLGGLAVGLIAREVRRRSHENVTLSRVTALDPSNAAAHEVFILPPIEQSDAKFVGVIHTDAGGRGTLQRMGHANFWPNEGKAIQPGCPQSGVNDKCSHAKAWAYWAESVANVTPDLFLALPADGNASSAVSMGLGCPSSARGDYFLSIDSDYGSVPVLGLNN